LSCGVRQLGLPNPFGFVIPRNFYAYSISYIPVFATASLRNCFAETNILKKFFAKDIAKTINMGYTMYIRFKEVLIMITVIQKWGNSHGIRIPKYILDAMNWQGNEQVEIVADEEKIVIKKANLNHRERRNINELFDGFTGTYKPIEIEWGEPVGKEIW
jgi:antitoxin MazE